MDVQEEQIKKGAVQKDLFSKIQAAYKLKIPAGIRDTP